MTPIPLNLHSQAFELINSSSNILLVTHINPDGDGVSSLCALMYWLKSENKNYTGYCLHRPPAMLDYLPLAGEIKFGELDEIGLDFKHYDLIIVLDCGSVARTNLSKEILDRTDKQKVVELDHHPKIDSYAEIELRDTNAAATAEIVYSFFKINKINIDKNLALCLLTGISTDTANFFYPSTSTSTVNIAADLVLRGGKLPKITESTLRNKSLEGLKLWGHIISNIKINNNYNIAITVLPKEIRNQSLVEKDELDGISGFLSNLYGVKGVLFLQDEAGGNIRGNLRTSHPNVDISKLARILGGGGHPKASGFNIAGKLQLDEQGHWKIV